MKVTVGLTSLMMLSLLVACGGKVPEKFATPSPSAYLRSCAYLDTTSAMKKATQSDSATLAGKTLTLVSVTSIGSQRTSDTSYQEVGGKLIVKDGEALDAEVLCSTPAPLVADSNGTKKALSTTTLENEVVIAAPRSLYVDDGSQVESSASDIQVSSVTLKSANETSADASDAKTETKSGFKTLTAWIKSLEGAKVSYFRSGEERLAIRVVTQTNISKKIEVYEFKIEKDAVAPAQQPAAAEVETQAPAPAQVPEAAAE